MSRPVDRLGRRGSRTASSGSFHAGAPIPTVPTTTTAKTRRQSSHRYQTFPAPSQKPTIQRRPDDSGTMSDDDDDGDDSASDDPCDDADESSPLPIRQLLLLAFLSLAEQTALNSISPYLPQMVASMPGIPVEDNGLYVGTLASAFALAQLSTNFMWGYASDIVGRKPVLLLGSLALMCCFCVFGLCRTYWQVVVVHVAMGMLNGNAACVPTVLGEVTDRSNQSRAFTYLPIIYSLGSITGPALGGLLVGRMGPEYPYLGPNVLSAALLAVALVVLAVWFEETLDQAEGLSGLSAWSPVWLSRVSSWVSSKSIGTSKPPLSRANSWAARWPRPETSASRPLLSSPDTSDDEDSEATAHGSSKSRLGERPPWRELMNKTTITLLASYLVFQLTNISFNSLYPIFAASPPPPGRGLDPGKIGVSLSLAGVATIFFQACLFQGLRSRLGNLGTYRLALIGIAASMVLIPWVGFRDDDPLFGIGTARLWLYLELGVILIAKNICAVGGLSSVMLLVRHTPFHPPPARAGLILHHDQRLTLF